MVSVIGFTELRTTNHYCLLRKVNCDCSSLALVSLDIDPKVYLSKLTLLIKLNEFIFESIGLNSSDCWITDLVIVFLFKEEHINSNQLGRSDMSENRSLFDMNASLSNPC